MHAPEFSRREVLKGGLSAVVLPHLGSGLTRPYQSSFDHLAFHREIAAVYADNPHLTRQHSSPEIVYINEKCGESIRITGVCPKTNVVEMIWVLATADGTAIAGIPFEHRHLNQDEIFHPLEGEVLAVIEDVPQSYGAGEHFTVKAGQNHVGWNASRDPLAVRVEYTPAMDGELA